MVKSCPLRLTTTLNACIAALIALLLWSGTSEATASCGDYLIPLGQATKGQQIMGQPMSGHRDQQKASSDFAVQHLQNPIAPCSGPSCGQAPTSDEGMTVVTEPTRDHQSLTLLTGKVKFVELLRSSQWNVSRQCAKEFLENGGLFRPPRFVAE